MLRHIFGELFKKGKRAMLAVNDRAPNFEVADHTGKMHRLKDYAGQRVVLYFYPKADTPGCTKQSCAYSDHIGEYRKKGVTVLGVSFDTAAENKAFAEKFGYTFPLLCDTERKIGLAYKACDEATEKYAKRFTYVIGPDGKIEQAIDTRDPGGQASDLLKSM